jgi:two-component system, OmpR family, sensor histidine kinase QseC
MTGGPRSLQARLLAWVLGLVVLVWSSAALLAFFDARHELDELLDGHLAQAAALLVAQQVHPNDDDTVDAPTLHRYAPKVAFQVFHEGDLVLRSANAPVAPMAAPRGGFESGFHTVQIGGRTWRVFTTHGIERDVQVYVGEQTDSRASIVWAIARSALWPMALALPLLALAVWWPVQRSVAPLRRLGRTLSARPAHASDPVHSDDAPSEMVPLVDALNGLLERIGALLDGERRFTADAAHELRTPIAAVRAQAQVAMTEADATLRHQALLRTLEGCDRATRVVEQLLTLSRLEAESAPSLATVDLCAIVRDVLAELAPRAIATQQMLELDAGAACRVTGSPTLLMVLVRNLVDNALRYSPAGARVRVRVADSNGRIVLGVEDSGPGLAAADLQRLGERFFRVAGSGASGSGLGWSIARRIAAVHGGDLTASRSAGLGGLAVELSLPAAGVR